MNVGVGVGAYLLSDFSKTVNMANAKRRIDLLLIETMKLIISKNKYLRSACGVWLPLEYRISQVSLHYSTYLISVKFATV